MMSTSSCRRVGEDHSTCALEDRKKRCLEGLRVAAGVSTFESCGIDEFRSRLRSSLETLVSLSRDVFLDIDRNDAALGKAKSATGQSFVRYDGNTIECILSPQRGGFDWSRLFFNHDDVCSRRGTSSGSVQKDGAKSTKSTALEEVLFAILDPTVIPQACVGSVFMVLVKAYVEDSSLPLSAGSTGPGHLPADSPKVPGRKSDLPHNEILRKSIAEFIRRSPILSLAELVGPYFWSRLRIHLASATRETNTDASDALNAAMRRYDVDAAYRALSLITFFIETLRLKRLEECAMESIAECIMDIDSLDVWLIKMRKYAQSKALKRTRCMPAAAGSGIIAMCCSSCRLSHAASGNDGLNASAQSNTRRRRHKTIGLSDLHDLGPNEQRDEEDGGIDVTPVDGADGRTIERMSLSRRIYQSGSCAIVPMKKIMNVTSDCSVSGPCPCLSYTESSMAYDNQYTVAPSNTKSGPPRCSLLPLKMVQLRSDLYRSILSMAKLAVPCANELHGCSSDTLQFSVNIQVVHCYSLCAATRLCAVLVADVRGIDRGYLPLMKRIWNAFVSSASASFRLNNGRERNESACHSYAELLVELAVFDDPCTFWTVMVPMLDCVLSLCRVNQEQENILTSDSKKSGGKMKVDEADASVEVQPTKEATVRLLLRAISYVFVHRRTTLSLVNSRRFQTYIAQLSIHYGEQELWISPLMSPDERSEVIHTLQALGILSFADKDVTASGTYKEFPFPASSSLRDAVGRMGLKVGCNRFLSSRNARQCKVDLPPKVPKEALSNRRRRRENSASEPLALLDYLNDDTIRIVFSFLGYRRLAKVTGTCKLWSSLGNEPGLWKRHYFARFKPLQGKELLPKTIFPPGAHDILSVSSGETDEEREWRKLFDAKWLAERALRSKFSRCGKWRHKTCDIVGCLSVVRSKVHYEKHISKHRSDLVKNMNKQLAVEGKKKKRQQDRIVREKRKAEKEMLRKRKVAKK